MLPANFNQLYYFWTVAKAGSVSAGAKRLLLNQSTVSLQLKQLEASLGRKLLSRGRQGARLTEAGEAAFEHAERMFTQAAELLAALREDGPAAAPVFRLGVSQSIPREKVLDLLRYVKERFPDVAIKILTRSSEELERRLERRLLDLAVSDLDLSVRLGSDYRGRRASHLDLYFVAAPALKRKVRAFPAGLLHVPLLMRAPENPIRKEVDVFLQRNGIVPNIAGEFENPDLIRELALRGEGAAVMDLWSAADDLRRKRLAALHPRPVGIRESVWFIGRSPRGVKPALQKLVEALMSRFEFGRESAPRSKL